MSNLAIANKPIDHAFEPIEGRPSQLQRSGWSKALSVFRGKVLFPLKALHISAEVMLLHPLVYSGKITAAVGKVTIALAQKVKRLSTKYLWASKKEIVPLHNFNIMELPADVRRYIWSFLDLTDLGKVCLVSKCLNKDVAHDLLWQSIANRINCPLENSGIPYYRQVIAFIRDLQRKASSTEMQSLDLNQKVNVTGLTIEDINDLQSLFQARDTLLVWETLTNSANDQVPGANVVGPGLGDLDTKQAVLSQADKFSDWFFENREILVQVRELRLGERQLTSLPDEICQIANLQLLYIYGNNLSMLPSEIGSITNLVYLLISNNQLTALPDGIDKFTNLRRLFLDRNRLTTLPDSVDKLTNLQSLSLSFNQLTALPNGIDKFTNLKNLYLNENRLTALPDEICKLTNLQELDIACNQISSLPKGIENLRLKKFELLDNPLPLKIKVASIFNYNKLGVLKTVITILLPAVSASIILKDESLEYQILSTTAMYVGCISLANLLYRPLA